VIAAEGDGRWGEYAGGYADWQRVKQAQAEAAAREAKSAPAIAPKPAAPAEKPAAPRSGKLSYNEKRELEALPDRIAALENEQTALHARMADPALYQSAPHEVAQCKARLAAIEAELEMLLLRWEELETRAGG